MENPEQPKPEASSDDLLNELRTLGRNLKDLLQTVWESEERRRAQQEIETGLNDLVKTLSQAADEFTRSPAGQTLRANLQDLQQRIHSGEVETKVRDEVISALRAANEGLQKASTSRKPPEKQQE